MNLTASEAEWPAYSVKGVERWQGGQRTERVDYIAEEAPVVLVYNGEPHVVMLTTPLDLEDFALGFSLTEGIAKSVADVEAIRVFQRSEGLEIRLRIPEARCASIEDKGRNLTGRTGCGLCGARSLAQAIKPLRLVGEGVHVPAEALVSAVAELGDRQRLNGLTGSIHAAAWATPGKGLQLIREDVGRHNALDKLIGALARKSVDFSEGFVVVTSRASYEMVQKCASVGISFLAAVSAPTALAIRCAEGSGLTLVGFARDQNHSVYANPFRLTH